MTKTEKRKAIAYIDYKDIETLRSFVNPYGRTLSRRQTGFDATTQRKLAIAIKNARFMGIMPYVER